MVLRQQNFVLLLKSFIANVLKCKTLNSLLTGMYENGNRLIKISAMF